MFRLFPLLLLLAACTTEQVADSRFAPTAPAVLSVSEPGLRIPARARFAWLPKAQEYHANERLRGTNINLMIEDAIQKALSRRQFVFQSDAAGADYLLAWVAALEGDLDDATIMRRFGIVPGIAAGPAAKDDLEKGTLIIYAIDARSGRRIWRSAMQTMVMLEMDEALRRQRIEGVVEAMFSTLPDSR